MGKSVNILGVTGSIGGCAADVIASDPGRFTVGSVTARENAQKLAETAIRLKARRAVVADEENAEDLKKYLQGTGIDAQGGDAAMAEASSENTDVTLCAITGMAGLRPTLNAIRNSKCVAIANKEPLVAAGPLIMREAQKHGTVLLPVDSEHNAIFQVFDFKRPEGIENIILTASGGPFRTWTREQMARATVRQALAHPNWPMGKKISIDSATMMNKALEIIEAHYLFNVPPDKIRVLVHPQSAVHSMVEYKDGSILAQMGARDMRTPIAHALAWPERMETPGQRLDIASLKRLDFEQPDPEKFPALALAYKALEEGAAACVALNAANEVAVDNFLAERIGFLGIEDCICAIMKKAHLQAFDAIEDIESHDRAVREEAQLYISNSGFNVNKAVML